MIISIIAAIDKKRGLGKDNKLLCHLPADLQLFKKITLNKPVIMGKNTFRSIGKPLPYRQNIVLTKQGNLGTTVETAASLQEAFSLIADAQEVFIIGGAQVYKEVLPQAAHLYLTVIDHIFDADTFFPEFNLNEWRCISSIYKSEDEKNRYSMTFYHYQR